MTKGVPRRILTLATSALPLLGIALLVCSAALEATQHELVRYGAIRAKADLSLVLVSQEAEQAGFLLHDRLISLGGQNVATLLQLQNGLAHLSLGSVTAVEMQRGSQLIKLSVPVRAKGVNWEFVFQYALAASFLVPCLVVALRRPRDEATYLFVLISMSLGLYYGLLRQLDVGLVAVQIVFLCMASAFTMHFFCIFPQERGIARSRRVLLLYVPSLVLLTGTLWQYVRSVEAGNFIWFARRLDLWKLVDFDYLCAAAALGLGILVHTLITASNPILKQQIKWIILGLGSAVVAGAADTLLTVFGKQSFGTTIVVLLGTIPVPVTFTLAILRYHLLDVDLVLRRSVAYGLLTAGLVAVYLLLLSFVSNALGLASGSLGYNLALFLSALMIGLIANPVRLRAQAWIDRYFFGQVIDPQEAIVRWSQRLSSHLRLADLAHILVNDVPQELRIKGASLLVPTPDRTYLVPLLTAGLGDSPTDIRSPLAVELASAGALPISKVTMLSERQADLSDSGTLAALTAWRNAGVELAVPLASGGQLVGIHLLGHKSAGHLYERRELDLLRTLDNQAAVAIANASLYEEVRAASNELEITVQQRTKELREFLSVVTHELNTPITALQGYTDLLLDRAAGPLTERQTRFLENMHRNVQRLRRLVLDLSDIARIDAGRMALRVDSLDLQQAVEEAVASQQALVEDKGLRVAVTLEARSRQVLGDPHRVAQVLTNLLSNACRFTPAGGQVEITSRAVDGYVEVAVADTGIGIRQEEQGRIFERFYRSEDPQVREQPGTGLGLAIARSLVELQGGKLWVISDPGKGSTFTFTLPAAS